jgi:hypothetical protein
LGKFLVEIKEKAEQRGYEPAPRFRYARPALKAFGPVGALTQSGSGTMVEASTMMGTVCQDKFDRQMC